MIMRFFILRASSGGRATPCSRNTDTPMLTGLSKRLRLRAALVLVAAYALCVLAPHAALAFGAAAHCLTDEPVAAHVHQVQPVSHTHADGAVHTHGAPAAHKHADADGAPAHKHSDPDGKNHGGTCCGLFCVSAIALDVDTTLAVPRAHAATLPGLHEILAGRGPDRLIRPPIA
jgi:hypothetical protein